LAIARLRRLVVEPKTILVVDDDASIRLLCRVNLEIEGFRVLEAATLAEARERLEDDGIDAILLDVHVGSDDGYELLRELSDRESPVRVALLTGSADMATLDARLADAVIAKPFSLETLCATARSLAGTGSASGCL
jgi:two-component system, OmpR family, response regulator